jgi:hypothetical protein
MAGRLPIAYVLFQAALLLAVLSSPIPAWADPITSTGRYMLIAFPSFWLLGRWTALRPRLEQVLVASGFMLQAALAIAFLAGGTVF